MFSAFPLNSATESKSQFIWNSQKDELAEVVIYVMLLPLHLQAKKLVKSGFFPV